MTFKLLRFPHQINQAFPERFLKFRSTVDLGKETAMGSKSKHVVNCPKCRFAFDITYGRALACSGCPSSVQCGMAKCPKCGHEFPLS